MLWIKIFSSFHFYSEIFWDNSWLGFLSLQSGEEWASHLIILNSPEQYSLLPGNMFYLLRALQLINFSSYLIISWHLFQKMPVKWLIFLALMILKQRGEKTLVNGEYAFWSRLFTYAICVICLNYLYMKYTCIHTHTQIKIPHHLTTVQNTYKIWGMM